MRSDWINLLWSNKYQTDWVCVCITILVTPHANLILYAMCYVVFWSLYGCTRLFPHFLTKGMIFENMKWIIHWVDFCETWYWELLKNLIIEYEICVFIFSETVKYFSCTEKFTDIISWIYTGFYTIPVILVIFAWKDFLNRFSKKSPIWNFMKIRTLGAELFHAKTET
jgi:hypothetical protein